MQSMETTARNPRWYHWTLLALFAVDVLTMGILNVEGGAAESTRLYAIDDVLVRLLGVGLILFSLGLPLRRNWAFVGSICFLALSILEFMLTYDFGASSSLDNTIVLATLVVLFGVPIALLAWLRTVFVRKEESQNKPLERTG